MSGLAFSTNDTAVKPLYAVNTGASGAGIPEKNDQNKTQTEKSEILGQLLTGGKSNDINAVNSALSAAGVFLKSTGPDSGLNIFDVYHAINDVEGNKTQLNNWAAAEYAGKYVDRKTGEVKNSTESTSTTIDVSKLSGNELHTAVAQRLENKGTAKQLKDLGSENVEKLVLQTANDAAKGTQKPLSDQELLTAMEDENGTYQKGYENLSTEDQEKADGFYGWLKDKVESVKETVGETASNVKEGVGKAIGKVINFFS